MKKQSLLSSFSNAINGIIVAVKKERNMKLHIIVAVIVIILSLLFKLSKAEYLFVFLAIVLVIISELINTAIEVLTDIVVVVYHPKAKIIKDVAAGATLVAAFFALVVAYFVFFDKVSSQVQNGIGIIKQSPMHIAIIALIVTIILAITGKAFMGRGKPLRGGLPSGHTAIAFSAASAIMMWTNDAKITLQALKLQFLWLKAGWKTKYTASLRFLQVHLLAFR
jgi:diacylglycerol kinase (ATP)